MFALCGIAFAAEASEQEKKLSTEEVNVSFSGASLRNTSEYDMLLDDPYLMQSVVSITFLDEIPEDLPSSAWDVSADEDNSVIAWVEPSSDDSVNETYYSEMLDEEISIDNMNDLYIAGDGGVYAGEISEFLFGGFENLKSIDFNDCFYVDNVIDMAEMFYLCRNLETLDLNSWNTSNVIEMYEMFCGCYSLNDLNISEWDTSNVIDMEEMFYCCMSLETLDVGNWDTSNVVFMSNMFNYCILLENLDVSNWDTSNVTDMTRMFSKCSSIKEMNLSNWDTSNVEDMGFMFSGCSALQELDLSGWDLLSLDSNGGRKMFNECDSLETLSISGWYITTTQAEKILESCPDQVEIIN